MDFQLMPLVLLAAAVLTQLSSALLASKTPLQVWIPMRIYFFFYTLPVAALLALHFIVVMYLIDFVFASVPIYRVIKYEI